MLSVALSVSLWLFSPCVLCTGDGLEVSFKGDKVFLGMNDGRPPSRPVGDDWSNRSFVQAVGSPAVESVESQVEFQLFVLKFALPCFLFMYICLLAWKKLIAVSIDFQPIEDPLHVPSFNSSQKRMVGINRNLSPITHGLPKAQRRLRVLTLNALCTPVPNNKAQASRLRALAQHIRTAEYDVVCLQEFMQHTCPFGLFDQAQRAAYDSFCSALHTMGFSKLVGLPRQGQALYDGGIAIFSKLPLTCTEMIPWVEQSSWDSWAAKGLVCAKIEVHPPPGVCQHPIPLHIVTLHAQASHRGWKDWKGPAEYSRVRVRQMHQVADVVAKRATKAGEAALVLGDFNFDARLKKDLTEHQEALKHTTCPDGPIDLVFETHGDHPVTHGVDETFLTSFENQGVPECLDHVYWWPASSPAEGSIVAAECAMQTLEIENFPHEKRTAGLCTHISDHFGWSVDLIFEWTCSSVNKAGLESDTTIQKSEPSDM